METGGKLMGAGSAQMCTAVHYTDVQLQTIGWSTGVVVQMPLSRNWVELPFVGIYKCLSLSHSLYIQDIHIDTLKSKMKNSLYKKKEEREQETWRARERAIHLYSTVVND